MNSFYVSRAVAATGVKAVLSGTGGDELFGGYPSFRRLPAAMRVKEWLGPVVPMLAPAIGAALPERFAARWRQFASGNGRVESAYRAQRGLFMPAELAAIAGPALRDRWTATVDRLAVAESTLFGEPHASTLEGDVARLETRVYLGSQLLRDLDVMSMAHGLEVRVPFVDHVLLDAVWPDLGAHPSLMRNKRLLHETLARPLPRGGGSAEAGVHAAVRAVDRRRAPAVRARRHGPPGRGRMGGARRARRDVELVEAGPIALEPSVGARRARGIPEEQVSRGPVSASR